MDNEKKIVIKQHPKKKPEQEEPDIQPAGSPPEDVELKTVTVRAVVMSARKPRKKRPVNMSDVKIPGKL